MFISIILAVLTAILITGYVFAFKQQQAVARHNDYMRIEHGVPDPEVLKNQQLVRIYTY